MIQSIAFIAFIFVVAFLFGDNQEKENKENENDKNYISFRNNSNK